MPHALQLSGSVCLLTHAVGFVSGHGCVVAPALVTQAPVAQVMQPAAASGQEVPQQIVPTQLPLMQSVPRLQAPPLALFARQVVPEQKNPGAQGTLPLQVVAHAVEEAHPKPLQVVAVPAVHVRAVEQVAAGTKVTALVVAVQVAAAHLFVQLPQAAAVMIEVSQPAAVVQSARPSLQVCTHEPVAQLPVEPVPLVHGA